MSNLTILHLPSGLNYTYNTYKLYILDTTKDKLEIALNKVPFDFIRTLYYTAGFTYTHDPITRSNFIALLLRDHYEEFEVTYD